MKLWKCYNCENGDGIPGVDFFADAPVCPTCKLDGADKRHGNKIVACKIIHFDPPHPSVKDAGLGHLACSPSKVIGKVDAMATGVPDVVNCPLCRATDDWKIAKSAAEVGSPNNVNIAEGGLAADVLARA